MNLRHLGIILLLCCLAIFAQAHQRVWLDGVEQPATASSGGGGNVSTTNNNTYTGNNTFSNGLITTQVALTDPASLGTVFSNELSSAVTAASGFYTDANQLVWFNSTNSTYTVKQSGTFAGQFGWTNTSIYQYGEYFARVRCVTSRGTAQAIGIRIVSAAGIPLNQVISSNNPVGQILSCGYTGANVRGVEVLLSSTPATWSVDLNDMYLTNSTVYDIASPGRVAIYAPDGLSVESVVLDSNTVNAAQGAYSSTLTLGGSNVLTSAGGSGATQAIVTVGSSVATSTISGATLSWSNAVTAGGGGGWGGATDSVYAVRSIGQFYASWTITTQTFPTAKLNQGSAWNTNASTWTPTGTGLGFAKVDTYLTNNASGGRVTLFHYVNGALWRAFYDAALPAMNDIKVSGMEFFAITNASDVHSWTLYNVGGMGTHDAAPDLNSITIGRVQ